MFDITQLFVSTAYAQGAGSSPAGSIGMSFVPLLLIFAVFYVLLIRPQQKKLDDHEKMVKALKRGDRVITGGGMHGKIVKVLDDNEHVLVEIADGVQVKIVRNTVSSLAAKTEPVPAKADDAGKTDKKD
jgi:preprotein translocase subunit YajC